jgi:hypothetical protein
LKRAHSPSVNVSLNFHHPPPLSLLLEFMILLCGSSTLPQGFNTGCRLSPVHCWPRLQIIGKAQMVSLSLKTITTPFFVDHPVAHDQTDNRQSLWILPNEFVLKPNPAMFITLEKPETSRKRSRAMDGPVKILRPGGETLCAGQSVC